MNYFSQRKKIFRCGLLGLWVMIWVVTGLFGAGLFRSAEALAKSSPMQKPWPARGASFERSDMRSEAQAASNRKTNPVARRNPVTEDSFWQEPFLQAIRLFQILISPADGDRCPMSPSCSQYAVEAIRTYGPWRGIVLTSDRLLRCGREDDYPLIRNQGEFRYYDPLGDNVIWP